MKSEPGSKEERLSEQGYEYYEGLDHAMGTAFRLHAFHPPGQEKWMRELADRIFDRIQADDRRLSIYQADSPISRINHEAAEEPVSLDPDTFALIEACKGWWKETDGLFDITAGLLMKKFGFHRDAALPKDESPAESESPRALTGCDKLELDPQRLTARLARRGMLIDLGGVAKGWSVERCAAMLQDSGLRDFVISAGTSTVLARGAPPGETDWPMELEGLHGEHGAHNLRLTDCALSISGNYRKKLGGEGGRVIRHIMDPRSLEPVDEIRQVVVSGPDAAECEVFSTALLILGEREKASWLADRDDIGVSIRREPVEP